MSAGAKFKIDLSGIPKGVLQEDAGDKVLKLRVPTPNGPKTLILRHKDVVHTEDPFVIHILMHYHPPKIPLKHSPGGKRKRVVYHDYDRHKKKRPFTLVDVDTEHHHTL